MIDSDEDSDVERAYRYRKRLEDQALEALEAERVSAEVEADVRRTSKPRRTETNPEPRP